MAFVSSCAALSVACNGRVSGDGTGISSSAERGDASVAGSTDTDAGITPPAPSGFDAGWDEGGPPPPSCSASDGVVGVLVQRTNLAAPTASSTGIAYDGVGLWILSGGCNARTNRLVRFAPDTRAIDRDFSFPNLIEQLGTGAYGITWDGSAVWISVSGGTNKLVKVDPTSGAITSTFSSPTDLGPSDLEFDGTDLWLTSGTGTAYSIDPATGGIARHFALPARGTARDNGVAIRGGELWSGELFGGVDVYDTASGALKGRAVHADCTSFTQDEVGASTFIGGELVMLSSLGITYYDVTAPTP